LSWTLHQFCLLQVLRMLDDWALRKFWLHSAPQGRVRYFEIVLSALKRDRKKPHKHKNVRRDKTTAVSDCRNTILVGLQKRSSQIELERFFNGVTGREIAPERIQSFTSVTLWGPRCI
jgi:hypothetical protein